jgi:hypothetical protein
MALVFFQNVVVVTRRDNKGGLEVNLVVLFLLTRRSSAAGHPRSGHGRVLVFSTEDLQGLAKCPWTIEV